jgi:hypothetical protein
MKISPATSIKALMALHRVDRETARQYIGDAFTRCKVTRAGFNACLDASPAERATIAAKKARTFSWTSAP